MLKKITDLLDDTGPEYEQYYYYLARRSFYGINNITNNRRGMKLNKETTHYPAMLVGLPPPPDILENMIKNPVLASMKQDNWRTYYGQHVTRFSIEEKNIHKTVLKYLRDSGERLYVYSLYRVFIYDNKTDSGDTLYSADWQGDYTHNERQHQWRSKSSSVTTGFSSYFVIKAKDGEIYSAHKLDDLREQLGKDRVDAAFTFS